MDEELDTFLRHLCIKGKDTSKFIKGYSDKAEDILVSLKYIRIDGEGIWKEIEITEEGRSFYKNGGFKGKKKYEAAVDYDRALENNSKKLNNIVIVATLIVSILSLAATIYFGLKQLTL